MIITEKKNQLDLIQSFHSIMMMMMTITGLAEEKTYFLNYVIQYVLSRTISWKNRSSTKWNYLQTSAWTPNHSSRFRVKHSFKARMKLQLDSSITNTPLKCHQVISQEILVDPMSSSQKLFWMCHSKLWKCLPNRNTLLAINRAYNLLLLRFYEDTARRTRKWSCRYDFKYHWPHSE